MNPKLDPAATIKAYKKLVKDLQAQVKELQAERDAAARLCDEQLKKIKRLEKKAGKGSYAELPY